jgi:hypothetical protein
MSTSLFLVKELKKALTDRYGHHKDFPLTWNENMEEYCGIQFVKNNDNSVKVHMGKHIRKFLSREGMDDIEGALTPALKDFFDPPSDSTPVDPIRYQAIQGSLIFYGPIRHDIKLFVNTLSKQNQSPTQSDKDKQLHIMRYLKEYPEEGPTFSANPSCYPDGPQLHGAADLGFATLFNGQSISGNLFTVGTNNASFASNASAEKGIVLSPQEGEYLSLGRCAKDIVFWQQFLDGLGFKQKLPIIIYEDNLPAINLVKAPQITRNSRHINIAHHFIRWLYQDNIILPVHQGTNEMTADFLTKVHQPRQHHYAKDVIFNSRPQLRNLLKAKYFPTMTTSNEPFSS